MRRVCMTNAEARAIRRTLTPAQDEAARLWAAAVSNMWGAVEALADIKDYVSTEDIPQTEPEQWGELVDDATWMIPCLKRFLMALECDLPPAVVAECIFSAVYEAADDPEDEEKGADADTPHLTA